MVFRHPLETTNFRRERKNENIRRLDPLGHFLILELWSNAQCNEFLAPDMIERSVETRMTAPILNGVKLLTIPEQHLAPSVNSILRIFNRVLRLSNWILF